MMNTTTVATIEQPRPAATPVALTCFVSIGEGFCRKGDVNPFLIANFITISLVEPLFCDC